MSFLNFKLTVLAYCIIVQYGMSVKGKVLKTLPTSGAVLAIIYINFPTGVRVRKVHFIVKKGFFLLSKGTLSKKNTIINM